MLVYQREILQLHIIRMFHGTMLTIAAYFGWMNHIFSWLCKTYRMGPPRLRSLALSVAVSLMVDMVDTTIVSYSIFINIHGVDKSTSNRGGHRGAPSCNTLGTVACGPISLRRAWPMRTTT